MLKSFVRMSDQDFKNFADMQNIKSKSFKILSKSCQEEKCLLTYSISYQTTNGDQVQFSSEVKKTAELVKTGSNWLISEVSNIQTFHESLEPLNGLE